MRICSFLPSATEIVFLLGLGDSLHGVSHECDFPPEALGKPKVVRSRFDSDNLSSGEIDRIVTDMMMRGENIYEVDADILQPPGPISITQQPRSAPYHSRTFRHSESRHPVPNLTADVLNEVPDASVMSLPAFGSSRYKSCHGVAVSPTIAS